MRNVNNAMIIYIYIIYIYIIHNIYNIINIYIYIYINLPVNAIVRLLHLRSGERNDQETLLALSTDK